MKESLQAPFSSYIIRKLGTEEKVKSLDFIPRFSRSAE